MICPNLEACRPSTSPTNDKGGVGATQQARARLSGNSGPATKGWENQATGPRLAISIGISRSPRRRSRSALWAPEAIKIIVGVASRRVSARQARQSHRRQRRCGNQGHRASPGNKGRQGAFGRICRLTTIGLRVTIGRVASAFVSNVRVATGLFLMSATVKAPVSIAPCAERWHGKLVDKTAGNTVACGHRAEAGMADRTKGRAAARSLRPRRYELGQLTRAASRPRWRQATVSHHRASSTARG
jgi:hypothetical protein